MRYIHELKWSTTAGFGAQVNFLMVPEQIYRFDHRTLS